MTAWLYEHAGAVYYIRILYTQYTHTYHIISLSPASDANVGGTIPTCPLNAFQIG